MPRGKHLQVIDSLVCDKREAGLLSEFSLHLYCIYILRLHNIAPLDLIDLSQQAKRKGISAEHCTVPLFQHAFQQMHLENKGPTHS